MTTSSNRKGLRKHINQIIHTSHWEGVDMTLRKLSVDLDPNGKPIGTSSQDILIHGIISQGTKKFQEAAGRVQDNALKGLFVWPQGGNVSLMPTIEDRIIENIQGANKTYVVTEIPNIDYDIDDPVLIVALLREVPNGV